MGFFQPLQVFKRKWQHNHALYCQFLLIACPSRRACFHPLPLPFCYRSFDGFQWAEITERLNNRTAKQTENKKIYSCAYIGKTIFQALKLQKYFKKGLDGK